MKDFISLTYIVDLERRRRGKEKRREREIYQKPGNQSVLRKNWLWGNLLDKNLVARVGVVMLGRRQLYVKRESVCVCRNYSNIETSVASGKNKTQSNLSMKELEKH